jgi:hypothetical protein
MFEILLNGSKINFNEYFKQQLNDLMYPSKRNLLVDGVLEGKDLEFMSLLKMFDHLFETNYSSNEVGL